MKGIVKIYAILLNLFLFKLDTILAKWKNPYKVRFMSFMIGHLIKVKCKFNIKYTL
jgi:hypothetical protein